MKLYVAGGCSEYGRNCFVIYGKTTNIMVDCGMSTEGRIKYPDVTESIIQNLDYLFLTHAHKDHAGAVKWLLDNGFHGTMVLSQQTQRQLKLEYTDIVLVEQTQGRQCRLHENVAFTWGRSGHCAGSVWYHIVLEDKKIWASGDYCEQSPIYVCDAARDLEADVAIVDCAYENDKSTFTENAGKLAERIEACIREGIHVILPVPQYGRGLDLIQLVSELPLPKKIKLDRELSRQMEECEQIRQWLRNKPLFQSASHARGISCIYLLADAQLRKMCNKKFIGRTKRSEYRIIITGHCDRNEYSNLLVENGQAEFIRYHVHQNLEEACALESKNCFGLVALNHCEAVWLRNVQQKNMMMPHKGEIIEF